MKINKLHLFLFVLTSLGTIVSSVAIYASGDGYDLLLWCIGVILVFTIKGILMSEISELKKRLAKARLLVVEANSDCNALLEAMQAKRMECEQLSYEYSVLEAEYKKILVEHFTT